MEIAGLLNLLCAIYGIIANGGRRPSALIAAFGSGARIVAGVGDSTLPSDPVFNGLEVIDAMFPFFDSSTQATQQFQSVMKKYAPSLGTAALPMNPAVTQAYASGLMFEAAIKASGASTVTPESIKDGLYSFKGETLGGLTVPLSFTKGKPSPHNCYFTYAIKNGKYVEPNGLKYTCVPDKVIDPILSALNR